MAFDAVATREMVQILPDQHVLVKAEEIGHVANERMYAQRFFEHVDRGNVDTAIGRLEQRGEHADERRLAGPIRSDQAKHLALGDLEMEILQGDVPVVLLAEVMHFDHACFLRRGPSNISGRARSNHFRNVVRRQKYLTRKYIFLTLVVRLRFSLTNCWKET